jgi:hypothetical protein
MTSLKINRQNPNNAFIIKNLLQFLEQRVYEAPQGLARNSGNKVDFILLLIKPEIMEFVKMNMYNPHDEQQITENANEMVALIGRNEANVLKRSDILKKVNAYIKNHNERLSAIQTLIRDIKASLSLPTLRTEVETKKVRLFEIITTFFSKMEKQEHTTSLLIQEIVEMIPILERDVFGKLIDFVKQVDKYTSENRSYWRKVNAIYNHEETGMTDDEEADFIAYHEKLYDEDEHNRLSDEAEEDFDYSTLNLGLQVALQKIYSDNDSETEEIPAVSNITSLLQFFVRLSKKEASKNPLFPDFMKEVKRKIYETFVFFEMNESTEPRKELKSFFKAILQSNATIETMLMIVEFFSLTFQAISISYSEEEMEEYKKYEFMENLPSPNDAFTALEFIMDKDKNEKSKGTEENSDDSNAVSSTPAVMPTLSQIRGLNQLHRAIVMKSGSESAGTLQHTLIGFLHKPEFMIEVLSNNPEDKNVVNAKLYKEKEYSVPSKSGNEREFLAHTSSYREEIHGKTYCIFYGNTIPYTPYAADDFHIYDLNTRASEASKLDHVSDIIRLLKNGETRATEFYHSLHSLSESNIANEMKRMLGSLTNIDNAFKKKVVDLVREHIVPLISLATFNSFDITHSGIDGEGTSTKLEKIESAINLAKASDKFNPRLDRYTLEALRYAHDATKMDMTNKINYNRHSIHSPSTYMCVTVRTPLDITYDKSTNLAYDVKIRLINLTHKPTIVGLMNEEVTGMKTFTINVPDKGITSTNVVYPQRLWLKRFMRNVKKPLTTVEVRDELLKCTTLYCSPEDYSYEIITGESLNIFDIIKQIELLKDEEKRSLISHNGYYINVDVNVREVINTILKKSTNPYLSHYLNADSASMQEKVDNKLEIVKQRMKEIAYSIYCRLTSSFGRWQDLTMAINKGANTEQRYTFNRIQYKKVSSERDQLNRKEIYTKNGYRIECFIKSIELKDDSSLITLQPLNTSQITRVLALDTNENVDVYYGILELFTSVGVNRPTYSRNVRITPQRKVYLSKSVVPIRMKEIIIAWIISSKLLEHVSAEDADNFRASLSAISTSHTNANTHNHSVVSSIGLEINMDNGRIELRDNVINQDMPVTIPLPITRKGELVTLEEPLEDHSYNDLFNNQLDMTFLYMINRALYFGSGSGSGSGSGGGNDDFLIRKLFDLYNTFGYGSSDFNGSKLGQFLHRELVERNLTEEQVNNLYFLFSQDRRNLILKVERTVYISNTRNTHEALTYTQAKIEWLSSRDTKKVKNNTGIIAEVVAAATKS